MDIDNENDKRDNGYLADVGSKLYGGWCSLKTPSTSTIAYAPVSSISSYKSTWQSWYEWQKKQAPVHFQRSDVFKKYASYNNIPELTFREEVTYVLGDFKYFIPFSYIKNDTIFWEHIKLLLDLYDCCKGVRRYVFGDSAFIILLKQCHIKEDIGPISSYDYNECRYDFEKIHTHTVAYFSLSTLIMRFTCHLLSLRYGDDSPLFIKIDFMMFKTMYERNCYGFRNISASDSFSHLHKRESNTYIQRTNEMTRSIPIDIKAKSEYEFSKSEPKGFLPNSYNECPGCGKPSTCNKTTHCTDCHKRHIELMDFYNHCDRGKNYTFKNAN